MANIDNLIPFKKGRQKTGGRKKGSVNISKVLERALKAKLTLPNRDGETETKTGLEWVMTGFLERGIFKGDPKVMALIFDRLEGKVSQPLEVDSDVSIEREIPTEELFGELDRIAEAVRAREVEAEADREREAAQESTTAVRGMTK